MLHETYYAMMYTKWSHCYSKQEQGGNISLPLHNKEITMKSTNNISTIKKFQHHITQQDKSDAYHLVADNAVWHSDEIEAPWSGIHKGIEAIKKHFSNISGTTKDFKRHNQEFIEKNDLVIEIGSLSCILNKTGKPFATEYVCLWKVQDGKIQSYRIFEDSLKLYRAYYND